MGSECSRPLFQSLQAWRQRGWRAKILTMASPLLSRSPQCISCIRRTAGRFGERCLFPAGQQIRGKKKTTRTGNKVNALLREDIDGYGKQGRSILPCVIQSISANWYTGTVISITAGMMRNQWFPQRLAEYATAAKLQELGLKEEDIIQLDTISNTKTLADEREVRKAAKAEAKALTKANTKAKPTVARQGPVREPVKPVELELLSVWLPLFSGGLIANVWNSPCKLRR